MTRIERQAVAAMSLLGLAVTCAPGVAAGQRDTVRVPIFVAVNFRSPAEPALGVEVAEALRQRMARIFPQKTRSTAVRVVTREEINGQLTVAQYPADSVISTSDLHDLGRAIGADESLEGSAVRTAKGVRVSAQFYSLNRINAPEMLPVIEEKDAGAAGRALAEAYAKARRELPDYERCRNSLIVKQTDQAIVAARAAMQQYDRGLLPRACLMSAHLENYKAGKTPVDSVVRVAEEILQLEPDYALAMGVLADAYLAKGDTAKAVEMNLRLYRADPTNVEVARAIIDVVAGTGAPGKAIPIARDLLKLDPADEATLDKYWKLLLATGEWKQAIAAGEAVVKANGARADTDYFDRQISTALADSQPRLAVDFLAKATAKFPRSTRYWLGYAQQLRKQGELQPALDAANHALSIDPKLDNGYAMVLSLYVALGQVDSALAFGRRAIAAGADKASIGGGLATLIGPSAKQAQQTNSRDDWMSTLKISSTVDSLAPSKTTKFWVGLSAGQIGLKALQNVGELQKTNKAAACAEARVAEDMLITAGAAMQQGGSVDPQTALQILNLINTYQPNIPKYKAALCKDD